MNLQPIRALSGRVRASPLSSCASSHPDRYNTKSFTGQQRLMVRPAPLLCPPSCPPSQSFLHSIVLPSVHRLPPPLSLCLTSATILSLPLVAFRIVFAMRSRAKQCKASKHWKAKQRKAKRRQGTAYHSKAMQKQRKPTQS